MGELVYYDYDDIKFNATDEEVIAFLNSNKIKYEIFKFSETLIRTDFSLLTDLQDKQLNKIIYKPKIKLVLRKKLLFS